MRTAHRVLVRKPEEGKRPLGTSTRYLGGQYEIEWGDVDWIDLAQDGDEWRTLVNTVMNLRVP